jgi:hypothetical protein
VSQFLWGATAVLCAVAALFFLKFWRRTRDGLFAAFSAAFATLAAHFAALGVLHPASETRHYLYVVRFAAFVIIIGGIVAKNRSSPPRRPPG